MPDRDETKPAFIHKVILDDTISDTTSLEYIDVSGFRRFSILAAFQGPPNGEFRIDIDNDNILVYQERMQIEGDGDLTMAKEYTVFGPSVHLVVYHPPAPLKVKISLYAGM